MINTCPCGTDHKKKRFCSPECSITYGGAENRVRRRKWYLKNRDRLL